MSDVDPEVEEGEEEEEEEKEKESEEDEDEQDKDGEEAEEVPEIPLTPEIVAESISLLSRIGHVLQHAYIKLDCRDRELTDIKLLEGFIHLRYIDISKNAIKDISPLSSLTHLLMLKCEENQLTSAKLEPLPYLQVLNVNHNRIRNLEGINHPLLEQLSANFNEIGNVGGAFGTALDPTILTRLHTLELRGNRLDSTVGIDLPSLKNLFLAANTITHIEGLSKCSQLTTLHLRENQLENLDGFNENLTCLMYINLRGNNITDVKQVKKLENLPKLMAIAISENPIADEDDYRMEVLVNLRKLIRLDKEEYMDEEREEADAIFQQRKKDEIAQAMLAEQEAKAAAEAAEGDVPEEMQDDLGLTDGDGPESNLDGDAEAEGVPEEEEEGAAEGGEEEEDDE